MIEKFLMATTAGDRFRGTVKTYDVSRFQTACIVLSTLGIAASFLWIFWIAGFWMTVWDTRIIYTRFVLPDQVETVPTGYLPKPTIKSYLGY